MFSDTRPFESVLVCVAITNRYDPPSDAVQHKKIISVQHKKIIYVQQATEATWLRRLGNLLCM